jgi:hypothetical protein
VSAATPACGAICTSVGASALAASDCGRDSTSARFAVRYLPNPVSTDSSTGRSRVFHSPAERIRRHTKRLGVPFRLVADPERLLYREFRVAASWPKLLGSFVRPSFVPAYAKSLLYGFWGGGVDGEFARMPADFVIENHGGIVLVRYGSHIGDHVRVADVIALRERRQLAAGAVA